MSLELCRQVTAEHPDLVRVNLGASCYQHTWFLIQKLRAHGQSAYFISKTAGEGQYTPPGFRVHSFVGFDGKGYTCTGVSHDAIYCNGLQYDTLAQANDSDEPIGLIAVPIWNPIPKEYWRPHNPPMLIDDVTVLPPEAPKPTLRIPSYGELGDDAFFRASIGVPLEADMALAGQALNNGSSVWFSRTTYEILVEAIKAGRMIDPAPIVLKYRNQWRAILGLPPL